MKVFILIIRKYIIFLSIIISLLISSVLWVTMNWSSFYNGKESEINTEALIIFDVITSIIEYDNKLVKENITKKTKLKKFNIHKYLYNIDRYDIDKNNYSSYIFNIFHNKNIINLNAYEYAEERLKIFNNLYKKHWLEVKDSKNNVLIKTKYEQQQYDVWDDKFFEEKKISKEVIIDDEKYKYTYGCKYRPYWYIALLRNISLFTLPDIFYNINFSWKNWVQETFLNVGKWEQIFSFWIIFLVLMLIIPFALKNIHDLYKVSVLLKYRYKSYKNILKKIKKRFKEQIENLSNQKNIMSKEDINRKKSELEQQYIDQIKTIKLDYGKQMTDIKSGFSKYYENFEKALLRYKEIINQQKKEIDDLAIKLQEHNISYDPYKFTDFKFKNKANILILGGEGSISINDAKNILKEFGLYNNTDIEWIAYRDMDRFDITKLQNTRNYSDIIVGAIPHSLINVPEQNLVSHLNNNSSLYPKYQILRKDKEGDLLQITKNNLKEAIRNSAKYKQVLENQRLNINR